MNYLLRPKVAPKVLEAFPKSAKEYAEIFKAHNQHHSRVKNPLYHLSIRFPKEVRPDREEFSQLAADVLNGMGLGLNRPYVVVMHEDEDEEPGRHIHIVTSRIDYSGKVWYGSHDAKQAIALCRELGKPERFKDVEPTYKDRDWGRDLTACAPVTHKETMLKKRTGVWLDKDHVAASLALVLHSLPRKGQAPLNKEFMEECALYGITPKVVHRASGKNGLVYSFNGKDYKASSLGRTYTLNGLVKHFHAPGKDNEPPAISLPLNKKDAFRARAWEELKTKGRRMKEDEKQELPEAACLYEMARELKHCEFEDLRATGDSIDTQLTFKMMPKDVLNLYQVYVRLMYLDLQNRRQEQARLRAIRPTLIRIKPEELTATDEEYRARILPRIEKYEDQFTDKTTHANWRGNHKPGERYPYKGHCWLREFYTDNQKKLRVDAERNARELREEIQEDKFNKLGSFRKALYKINKEKQPAKPPLPEFKRMPLDKLDYTDTEFELRDARQKELLMEYEQIRKRCRAKGILIDADDRADEEAWERKQARRAQKAREQAEQVQAPEIMPEVSMPLETPEEPAESHRPTPKPKPTPAPSYRHSSRSGAPKTGKKGRKRYDRGGYDR